MDTAPTNKAALQVYITVDTEASIAGAFADPLHCRPLLDGPVDGEVNGQSEALGFLLRTLQHYNLTATFFTESLQNRYFGIAPMQRRAGQILDAGQDLQLHVHPCWLNFADGRLISPTPNDASTGRPLTELTAIFQEARQRFIDWGFGAPVAVRTGNFSTGLDTFAACAAAGLQYSSNIAAALLPRGADAQLQRYYGFSQLHGVTELPLTSFQSYRLNGAPCQRIMAITACSVAEMTGALQQAWQQGLTAVCILTHPFEFIKRRNGRFEQCRVNRLNQSRFEALCRFIAEQPQRFSSCTFGQLPQQQLSYGAAAEVKLRGSYRQMVQRSVQNLINDHLG
ncbi:polysaccharide deacetylase [Rheinheimera sp. NSM]|uniref:polysaccharide deacetylase n=1 Tax=Rheinheimera sp. NSM TaxID=3457884 RepID=UPI00403553C3